MIYDHSSIRSAYLVGRLTNINHNGPSGNLLFTNYTLDANAGALWARTTMASNGGTETYTLDALNRLTNATYPNGDTAAYSYDANAGALWARLSQIFNGVTTNYTYDDAGQLLTDGATSYSYDANGNLITAGADSYAWDWANRLTGANVGGNSASYAYGAFDVRVSGAVVAAADYTLFGEYRNQTGVTSRFGFTGEYYAQETGMWHLRARDLHPGLGRFLSADPVQPNAPGTQGYNRYAYVANNPTTWVDPSGYSVEPATADQALLNMMYAMRNGGLHGFFQCALSEACLGLQALIWQLGSSGANFMTWTAEELQGVFFSTYPHQPTPVDPGLVLLSIGLSNTPVIGDLYDLYTGVTGYDPITGQYLAGWVRCPSSASAAPICGMGSKLSRPWLTALGAPTKPVKPIRPAT